MLKTYSDLRRLDSFEDRYEYLRLGGFVGQETFGFERYLNQTFYRSKEWKDVREQVIARDYGLDLGVEGYEIYDKVIVHHMNPITVRDVVYENLDILDPEFLITTTHKTHNAIHYGDRSLLPKPFTERKKYDTKLW